MSMLTQFERFDPFEELMTLRNRMDRLWSRVAEDEKPSALAAWSPTADIVEKKDEILVTAELPGVSEKDVSIEVEGGVLTIRGERKQEKETEEKGYHRIERSYGSFMRAFKLPVNVEPDRTTAIFTNGLLEVHLPKKAGEQPHTVKIDVRKPQTKTA